MLVRVNVERVTLDTATSRFVVILKEEKHNRWLPIVVGSSEAQAIALQLENIAPPRPLTHDLIRNLLETMHVKIERIVVSDLRENTYYALLGLRRSGEFIDIDARPSDAIALALRTHSPIYVDGNVMQQAGINGEENLVENAVDLPSEQEQLEKLNTDLVLAVQEERYEEAAKIRDTIATIKEQLKNNVE